MSIRRSARVLFTNAPDLKVLVSFRKRIKHPEMLIWLN